MRGRSVALLLLVALLAACEGFDVESNGPELPNTCVVKADEPHLSSTARRKGYRSMVAKAWFSCSTPLHDATLELEIQEREGRGWVHVDSARPSNITSVKLKKKYESVLEIACARGTYRARAHLSGRAQDGTPGQSAWLVSRSRTDPCGEG